MEIHVPLPITFDCPSGTFPGIFYEYREIQKYRNGRTESYVRLLFMVETPPDHGLLVLVGRNFVPTLANGSELRNFLDLWLGPEFVPLHTNGGKFDFTSLNHRAGTLLVRHIYNDSHKAPFVHLAAVVPIAKTNIGTSSNDLTATNTATGTTAPVPEPKFPSHEELTETYSRSMNLPASEVGKVLTSMQELIQAVTQSRLWDRWLTLEQLVKLCVDNHCPHLDEVGVQGLLAHVFHSQDHFAFRRLFFERQAVDVVGAEQPCQQVQFRFSIRLDLTPPRPVSETVLAT